MGTRYRYQRLSGVTRNLLAREGEAGRFEFKQTAEAVSGSVLVAAANAAFIDGVTSVTILVGVAEEANSVTGVVSGSVVGLEVPVERAKGQMLSRGSQTYPVPVGLTVVEENVQTSTPILRLEIRPTRTPHYDSRGARLTRYGASTRPLTDDELLGMYLDREAEAFEARFRRTAAALLAELEAISAEARDVRDDVREIGEAMASVHQEAEAASTASMETFDFVGSVQDELANVHAAVEELRTSMPIEEAWWRVVNGRHAARTAYDALRRNGVSTVDLDADFEELMASTPALDDYALNVVEGGAWEALISAIMLNEVDTIRRVISEIREARARPPSHGTLAYHRYRTERAR